jgi:hypothetical protein
MSHTTMCSPLCIMVNRALVLFATWSIDLLFKACHTTLHSPLCIIVNRALVQGERRRDSLENMNLEDGGK